MDEIADTAQNVCAFAGGLTNLMINDFVKDSVRNDIVTEKVDSVVYLPPVTEVEEEPEPLVFVEELPVFPGRKTALFKFIAEHTIYPAEALENNIQGKVFVRFVVSSDGSVKRAEVTRGLYPSLDGSIKGCIGSPYMDSWQTKWETGTCLV